MASPLARVSWPARVCALGAVAALAVYFARSVQPARRTAVGTERRLFTVQGLDVKLHESSEGGEWAVVPSRKAPDPSTPARVYWAAPLTAFTWPFVSSPRCLMPFQASGTWVLRGGGLRRLWRYNASQWLDRRRLLGQNPLLANPPVPQNAVLDLRTGRTRLVNDGVETEALVEVDLADQVDEGLNAPPEIEDPLAEGGSAFETGHRVGGRSGGGKRSFHLIQADDGPGLCAVSEEVSPRLLPLARGAAYAALSRDARTLFFVRGGALWRLDLRKPVPDLLTEVPTPELPDPLEGHSRSH